MFPWHGLKEAVEAVNQDASYVAVFDGLAHHIDELAGRNFRGIKMRNGQAAGLNVFAEIHPQTCSPARQTFDGFLKNESGGVFSAFGRTGQPAQGNRRLAASRRTNEQGAGSAVEPASYQSVEFRDSTQGRVLPWIGAPSDSSPGFARHRQTA